MIKSIIGLLVGIIFLSTNCYAMTFSGIKELGKIGGLPTGGFCIHGADYNNGTSYKNGKFDKEWKDKLYEKGIARYGTSDKGLWIHYDCSYSPKRGYENAYSPKFGDRNQTVTVSLGSGEGENVDISKISNDENITMYFLAHYGCVVGAEIYVIMGYDKSGKFVKYVDSRDLVKNYLGEKNFGLKGIYLKDYYCRGDSIIIEYHNPKTKGFKIPAGAFHLKWDEKAQWFGIDHVKY